MTSNNNGSCCDTSTTSTNSTHTTQSHSTADTAIHNNDHTNHQIIHHDDNNTNDESNIIPSTTSATVSNNHVHSFNKFSPNRWARVSQEWNTTSRKLHYERSTAWSNNKKDITKEGESMNESIHLKSIKKLNESEICHEHSSSSLTSIVARIQYLQQQQQSDLGSHHSSMDPSGNVQENYSKNLQSSSLTSMAAKIRFQQKPQLPNNTTISSTLSFDIDPSHSPLPTTTTRTNRSSSSLLEASRSSRVNNTTTTMNSPHQNHQSILFDYLSNIDSNEKTNHLPTTNAITKSWKSSMSLSQQAVELRQRQQQQLIERSSSSFTSTANTLPNTTISSTSSFDIDPSDSLLLTTTRTNRSSSSSLLEASRSSRANNTTTTMNSPHQNHQSILFDYLSNVDSNEKANHLPTNNAMTKSWKSPMSLSQQAAELRQRQQQQQQLLEQSSSSFNTTTTTTTLPESSLSSIQSLSSFPSQQSPSPQQQSAASSSLQSLTTQLQNEQPNTIQALTQLANIHFDPCHEFQDTVDDTTNDCAEKEEGEEDDEEEEGGYFLECLEFEQDDVIENDGDNDGGGSDTTIYQSIDSFDASSLHSSQSIQELPSSQLYHHLSITRVSFTLFLLLCLTIIGLIHLLKVLDETPTTLIRQLQSFVPWENINAWMIERQSQGSIVVSITSHGATSTLRLLSNVNLIISQVLQYIHSIWKPFQEASKVVSLSFWSSVSTLFTEMFQWNDEKSSSILQQNAFIDTMNWVQELQLMSSVTTFVNYTSFYHRMRDGTVYYLAWILKEERNVSSTTTCSSIHGSSIVSIILMDEDVENDLLVEDSTFIHPDTCTDSSVKNNDLNASVVKALTMTNTNENRNETNDDSFDYYNNQVENKDRQLLGQCHVNEFQSEIQHICSSPLIFSIIVDDEKDCERLPTTSQLANTIYNNPPLYSNTEGDGGKGNDLHIHDKDMTTFSNLTLIQDHMCEWNMQDGIFFDGQHQYHRLRHLRHQRYLLQSTSTCSPYTDMTRSTNKSIPLASASINNAQDAHSAIFNQTTTKAAGHHHSTYNSICPSFNTIDQYYSQLFYRDMTNNSFQHSSNNETKEKRFFEIPAFLTRSRLWIQDKIRESQKNSSASQERYQGKNHHSRSNNTIFSRSGNRSSSAAASKSKDGKDMTRIVSFSKTPFDSTLTANDYNQSTNDNHRSQKRITLDESKLRMDYSGEAMEGDPVIPSNNILDYYEDEPIMESVSQYLKMAISNRKLLKKKHETTKI